MLSSKEKRAEYGDFQTPAVLARQICSILQRKGLAPVSVLEPNCGAGALLIAALNQFPTLRQAVGLEINPAYVQETREALGDTQHSTKVQIILGDFFTTLWDDIFKELSNPLLVIGNPPWVTNAALGSMQSVNLPVKSNFHRREGIDAITGKGNFDISEWMLLQIFDWLSGRRATLAMLCKTAIARKVLTQAWKNNSQIVRSEIFAIDASSHFGAAVDACLLVCAFEPAAVSYDCGIFPNLEAATPSSTIGWKDGSLVANIECYQRWKHLEGSGPYQWRSGIKHDCAQVLELERHESGYRNRLGATVDIEETYVYPMLKSSHLANNKCADPSRLMLVTQNSVGQDTRQIRETAPKTWKYLLRNGDYLDRRASSIYKKRPRFSIFGVGEYSFAPWKVAISGFYKSINFRVVGPYLGKPIVLDDTAYFIACKSEEEARYLCNLLNNPIAQEFYRAFVFWDAKRPITIDLLRRLNLSAVERLLGSRGCLDEFRVTNQPQVQAELALK